MPDEPRNDEPRNDEPRNDEPRNDETRDLRNIWQEQETEQMRIATDELRRKASAFQKRIGRRNLREYIGAGFVIPTFSWMFFKNPDPVARIGFGLTVIATCWIVYHLHKRGSAQAVPAELGASTYLQFHRRELERQRDLVGGIWRWYLGPLAPGMAILTISGILNSPPARRWFAIGYAVFAVLLFWGVGAMNQKAARKLDSKIAGLRLLENSPSN